MGGSNTFNKALNALNVKKKKPPNVLFGTWLANEIGQQSKIYVDMSVLLYCIHATSSLGFDSFFSQGQDDDDLIQRYLIQLEKYLDPLQTFNVVMVFEAGGSRQNSKKSRILNNGIRNVFLKNYHGSTPLGKKAVSRSCGLPHLEIQIKIAIGLKAKYRFRYHFAASTTDALIFQLANAAQSPCFVYSVDQDYLIYSNFISGLIGPKINNRFVVKRNVILQKLGISSHQLIWCFCAAGSDDVQGLPKIGFKKALHACRGVQTIANTSNQLLGATKAAKKDLANRIQVYLNILKKKPEQLVSIPARTTVSAHDFIFETKSDGSRRRLHRLALDPTAPFGIGLAPWVQFGRNLKETAKYQRPFRKIDESKAKNARTFTFRLESGPDVETSVELPLPEQQANQKKKRRSKKRKAKGDLEPAREVKKRTRNQEKKVLDRLSALHMKCVRTIGSVKSLVPESIAAQFVPWFQKELVNIKVFNY